MLGEAQAAIIHNRARTVGDAALTTYVQLHDALFGIYPAAVLGGQDHIVAGSAINAAVATYAATWKSLFNESALCDCTQCRSVYSPAAYLVDLLNFLDASAKTANVSPLDVLLARRPDIAGLKLTCENTETEIPYVDLVNEILESLVVSLDPSQIPPFDTDGATPADLRAAPQHTISEAYVTPDGSGARPRLDRTVYPRSLPFDAPLAAARTYLNHLEVNRADLMAAFTDGPLTNALAAERLGLSPGVFQVIAGETLEGAPTDFGASLDDRYGRPWSSPVLNLSQVPAFLTQSGLSFEELVQILGTRFINPEAHTFEIVRALGIPGAELAAFVQGGFQNLPAASVTALGAAGVTDAAFTAWAQTHFSGETGAQLRQTILVDSPADAECSLDNLTLRHWDTAAGTPADSEWMKLDRLIRLWRALGWAIEDLDLALCSVSATDISGPVLRQLAQIAHVSKLLDLSIPQVVALWADPDPSRPQSLYAQRFRSRALLRLDPVFEPDWAGNVLAGATIGEHVSALQAGLRVTGADLSVLRARLALTDDAAALTLERLGALLRLVTLARALRLNIRDLVSLLDLTGLDPFGPPTDDWAALRFVRDAGRLKQAGMNVAQLEEVLGDVSAPGPDVTRDRLLTQIQDGVHAIAADLDPDSETDGSFTRHALTLLGIDPLLIDAVLPVLLGTDRATALLPAPAAPAPVIPVEWADRLVYDAGSQAPSLSCLGALTDAELATILEFSADAGYRAAVIKLHAAPRQVLQNFAAALSQLGVPSPPAADQLLTDTLFVPDRALREPLVRGRLAMLLGAILPSLRDRLGRTLVKQALRAVQPDAVILAMLLEGMTTGGRPLMPAQDLNRPLILDFLSLDISADTTAAAQGYEVLTRLTRLATSLGLDAADVSVLARHVVVFRPTIGQFCSYDDWAAIVGYARVRGRTGQPKGALAMLWEADSSGSAQAALAAALGWAESTIADLSDPAGLALDLMDVQVAPLERLITAGEVVIKLGVSVWQAANWARSPITQSAADEIRRAVKARYDEPAWLEVAGTLSDPLRDARRSALVDYLLPRLGLRDANALYQRLLIDVGMSPCMTTSRIKQAISTTQLFIQRCLLNLEPDVPPAAIDPQHWEWMKNYRVWEANRKVLLYPENWIIPELRDDKTPFFRELESELLQNDVSDANVERSLTAYVAKLDGVAKLDIVAIHVQDADFEPDEKLRTVVHIFGRTSNPPYAYHYRRYIVTHNGAGLWTPWEPVPVDIQGTLIAPAIFNRRLYLFWVTFTANGTDPRAIGLAWSEYRDGVWSPVSMTDAKQLFTAGADQPGIAILRLEAWVESDQLRLVCITAEQFVTSGASVNLPGHYGEFAASPNGNLIATAWGLSFVLGDCGGVVSRDVSGHNIATGLVIYPNNGALQAKPLSRDLPALNVVTLLSASSDLNPIAVDKYVLGDGGYFIFKDGRRTYLARISAPSVENNTSTEGPSLQNNSAVYHSGDTVAYEGTARAAATARSGVTESLTRAEASRSPWTSAAVSLAGTGQRTSLPAVSNLAVGANGAALFSQTTQVYHPSEITLATNQSTTIVQQSPFDHPVQNTGFNQGTTITQQSPFDHPIPGTVVGLPPSVQQPKISVHFEPLSHPFVCTWIKGLLQYGVPGVLKLPNQNLQLFPTFANRYVPNRTVVPGPDPTSGVDFGTEKAGVYRSTAYSEYNWELFFHLPMLVADRLMQNRRFEDARRWLHYVFNPTDGAGGYWKVVPLQAAPVQSIEDWLKQLNAGDSDLQQQIAEWKDHPFEPHRIARMRLPAYKKFVLMKYLDNLIAWGDSLFELDTIESINSATQLYVLAADLLGDRPERIPPRGDSRPMSFADMRGNLDPLSNAAVEFENAIPFISATTMASAPETVGLLGITRSLYFCLPPNDKLLAYWDIVADRLFKVRHCMNLAGVFRQLPLYEPEIDPALLVAATAQGLDIGSVLADVGAPLPYHRFRFTFQRALEACADVRALGAALLATLEKKDAEELALLRATQEVTLRTAWRESRKQQEMEAMEQVEVLKASRAVTMERRRHFLGLMGLGTSGSDTGIVTYDPKPSEDGGVFLIDEEMQELASSHSARDWQVIAATTEILAGLVNSIPMFSFPVGVPVTMSLGGATTGFVLGAIARYQNSQASQDSYDASHAGKMATYKRRQQDYTFQANLAAREITQIDAQITAATIRAQVATQERKHLETEIEQAELVEQHLRSKYTNTELYGWMHGQITSLYFQSYQLALELAKSAERCFRFERGLTSSNYVRSGGWDNLHAGLLAGDTLQLQLRQLERAHHTQDRRELEIAKHISLRQHAPLALISLKQLGRCEVELPELLYDMDYPGHYMRRVKSVSVTIPAVTGPFTSLNATLTMLKNETRITAALRGGKFERDLENDDDRFVSDFAPIQAIVTSTGQNDSGLFEPGVNDERYLPFEGAGAVGRWRIEVDPDCNRFDLESICDIVLHVSYTARDGGQLLAQKSKEKWKKVVADAESAPLSRLFSLKQEFPSEWYRLRTAAEVNGDHVASIAFNTDRFPMLFRRRALHIGQVDLFGVPIPGKEPAKLPEFRQPDGTVVALSAGAPLGRLVHRMATVDVSVKDAESESMWRLSVAAADVDASIGQMDDLLVMCQYDIRPITN